MPRPDFTVLPKAMGAWRNERGLTQREVARAAQTTVSTVARIETGDLRPSWFTFVAICNALHIRPDWVADIRRAPEEVSVA